MNGQSIGKKITGLKVVNENGGQPSVGQYIIRWLIRTADITALIIIFTFLESKSNNSSDKELMMRIWKISFGFGLFILDIILVNASKKNQRLGDMLAHTLVIRTTERMSIEDTVFLNIAENYIPSFPQVMQLSDRDINSLKGILDTARKRHDYALAEMAANKIKTHLKIETSISPFDFLEILLKDYNYLSVN